MQSVEYTIEPGDPATPDVIRLLAASEEYAQTLYPPESIHMLDRGELVGSAVRFLVARSADGLADACGAIVLGEDSSAELKRMFVASHARRRGLGGRLLQRLEEEARVAGVEVVRLETGIRQPEAVELYRKHGYRERATFGSYVFDPLSIYMEKFLAPGPRARVGDAADAAGRIAERDV